MPNTPETKPAETRPPARRRFDDGGYGGYSQDSYDSGYGGPSFGEEDGLDGRRRYNQAVERRRCRFCRDKLDRVDYKDVLTLQKLCTNQGRVFSRKRSGNCATHQRLVKKAIKQARYIGLIAYSV